MNSALVLGTAKVDITPMVPVSLAGFAHRAEPAQAVRHSIHARILTFSVGSSTVVLVSADLIGWSEASVSRIKEKIKLAGYKNVHLILHATHNHSGPQTSDRYLDITGAVDALYLQSLEEKIVNGVTQAMTNTEGVLMERGSGSHPVGIHRRSVINGTVTMAPNAEGPTDHEVTVLRFKNQSGVVKAVLVHFTCHPTTTDDCFVSSEYPGLAMDYIEQEIGEHAVSVFLQGFCGDVRPALISNGAFYRGGDSDVVDIAHGLSHEVLRVLNSDMVPVSVSELKVRELTIPLELQQEDVDSDDLFQRAKELGVSEEWVEACKRRGNQSPQLDMMYVAFSRDFSVLTTNAEMVVKYGLLVKECSSRRTLPIGYTNGSIGYVPTAQQILEGGYESLDSIFYVGWRAPYVPHIEEIINQAIRETLED